MNFKWLIVPKTNETKAVKAVLLWEVRWYSRQGSSISDKDNPKYCEAQPEMEAFLTKDLADEFATALRQAFYLLRYSGTGLGVRVNKRN